MTKTSVYRIVSTLQRRGYLSREASERVFIAGPALLAFARLLIGNTALTALAHPILQDLHEELGETINLAILDRHRILYVDMVESAQGLRMAAQVGTSGSVYSTALGKAILADLPRDQARKILTSVERPAYTANTKTGIADLMHELDAVKAHGWALDDEENEVGARCIGVAVRDSAGMSIGAISASGPAWRLPDEKVAGVGTVLQGAALRIEEQCGYKHVKSTSGATRSNAVSRSGRSRD
jgi:IclR family acetate operon transcriptional repressor